MSLARIHKTNMDDFSAVDWNVTTFIVVFFVFALLFAIYAFVFVRTPSLYFCPSDLNEEIINQISQLTTPFWPTFWMSHQLPQALAANFLRTNLRLAYQREILRMGDGETIALDWWLDDSTKERRLPIIVMLHGISGGSHEINIQQSADYFKNHGFRVVVFNRRGCAEGMELVVQRSRPYQYGCTQDLEVVLRHIQARNPSSPLVGCGLSAGSNPLCRYLGETGKDSRFVAAISVANAFDLDKCSKLLSQSPMYDRFMTGSLRSALFERHSEAFHAVPGLSIADIQKARSVREFDGTFTCRLYGYKDVSHYHSSNSSVNYLPHVRVPLLCLNALDDPIVHKSLIPYDEITNNPFITLVTTVSGGHLGWVDAWWPFNKPTWMERLCLKYFQTVLNDRVQRLAANLRDDCCACGDAPEQRSDPGPASTSYHGALPQSSTRPHIPSWDAHPLLPQDALTGPVPDRDCVSLEAQSRVSDTTLSTVEGLAERCLACLNTSEELEVFLRPTFVEALQRTAKRKYEAMTDDVEDADRPSKRQNRSSCRGSTTKKRRRNSSQTNRIGRSIRRRLQKKNFAPDASRKRTAAATAGRNPSRRRLTRAAPSGAA